MDGSMQMNGMMRGCMAIAVVFFLTLITTSIIQTVVQIKILKEVHAKKK
jgi:hypothetical protein